MPTSQPNSSPETQRRRPHQQPAAMKSHFVVLIAILATLATIPTPACATPLSAPPSRPILRGRALRQAGPQSPLQSPTVIPIPQVVAPSRDPSPTPIASSAPTSPQATPPPPTSSDTSTSPSPSPSVLVSPALEDSDGGGGLATGAIVGIAIGAVALLLLLLLCCFCLFVKGRRNDRNDNNNQAQQTAVYSSSEAAATPPPPPPPAVVPPPAPFAKDEAREFGSSGVVPPSTIPPPGEGGSGEEEDDGLEGAADALVALPIVGRGPTPPPHDYVLGAGPATTRTDFDDLHARFEREEIGDNSAVLGKDHSTDATALAAIEGAPATTVVDEQDDGDDDGGGEEEEEMTVAESGGGAAAATFEAQEQMMGGNDGSGAISDATMVGLHAATITEEGGDVPSLERDPIEMSRERGDNPF